MDPEIKDRFDSLETRFDGVEARFDGLESRFASMESRFDRLETRFSSLQTLVVGLMDSCSREIGGVRDQLTRMETRLDKISAGSHYVADLVKWSDKQDQFQADILRRIQELERRVSKLPPEAA